MRVREGKVLPKILSTVGNLAVASLASGGRSPYQLFRKFDELQGLSDRQLRNVVRYAIDKRYVTVIKRAGKNYIELTKAGSRLVGKEAIAELKPKKPKMWDSKWRLVLFDIPEAYKTSRDGFAGNLKRIGFVQIQKSVFAYPHPCFEEVEVLADFHKVGEYLTCILAERIYNSERLHRHFKLS